MKVNKKGFTLLEMLVVVLIIGILASIAIPQYQMAVTKAKVASILPLMRRWKDALQEYKLQHGHYGNNTDGWPDADTLGVNWPSDWECTSEWKVECSNDYWHCYANETGIGEVTCTHDADDGGFWIGMFQADDPEENYRDKVICNGTGSGKKVCKALSSNVLYEDEDDGEYSL